MEIDDINRDLLEFIDCNICGSKKYHKMFDLNGWPIVKCDDCGFCYVNPRPKQNLIEEGYNNDNDLSPQVHGTGDLWEYYSKHQRRHQFNMCLEEIENKWCKPGRILDFGCGAGFFVKSAQDRGWEAYGVEIGSWARKAAVELGINIRTGTLPEANFPTDFFDVVFFTEVIEHLADPYRELLEIKRVLKPRGFLVGYGISNINSLLTKLGLDDFYNNKPLGHLNYFSHNSLKLIASKAGFQNIKISAHGLAYKKLLKKSEDVQEKVEMLGIPNNNSPHLENKNGLAKHLIKPGMNFFLDLFGIGDTLYLVCQK